MKLFKRQINTDLHRIYVICGANFKTTHAYNAFVTVKSLSLPHAAISDAGFAYCNCPDLELPHTPIYFWPHHGFGFERNCRRSGVDGGHLRGTVVEFSDRQASRNPASH